MWLSRFLPKLPYFKGLVLTSTSPTPAPDAPLAPAPTIDIWPAIGLVGTAMTDLKPGGSAQFPDAAGDIRITPVVSESGFVPVNSRIVVRELRGSYAIVRPV
jgi:hypothetical protein